MKKTSVIVDQATEEAVIEKAWREYRVRSWQGAMDLAIKAFLGTPAPMPPSEPEDPRLARVMRYLSQPGNLDRLEHLLRAIVQSP